MLKTVVLYCLCMIACSPLAHEPYFGHKGLCQKVSSGLEFTLILLISQNCSYFVNLSVSFFLQFCSISVVIHFCLLAAISFRLISYYTCFINTILFYYTFTILCTIS